MGQYVEVLIVHGYVLNLTEALKNNLLNNSILEYDIYEDMDTEERDEVIENCIISEEIKTLLTDEHFVMRMFSGEDDLYIIIYDHVQELYSDRFSYFDTGEFILDDDPGDREPILEYEYKARWIVAGSW